MQVGIVLTGLFCGEYLFDTLKTVQNQDDPDWSCGVVFDPLEHGPTIREVTSGDSRFVLIESRPVNVCAARNHAYSQVDGELLVALDGDDLIEPTYISTLRLMMERTEVSIAYTGTRYFGDLVGIKHEIPYSPRVLAVRNPIVSAAMIRRRDFDAVGGYDERLAIGYEDWDLWISILKRGGEVAFDPVPLFLYRQRPTSRSRQMDYATHTKTKEYIFQKHKDFCWHSPL